MFVHDDILSRGGLDGSAPFPQHLDEFHYVFMEVHLLIDVQQEEEAIAQTPNLLDRRSAVIPLQHLERLQVEVRLAWNNLRRR